MLWLNSKEAKIKSMQGLKQKNISLKDFTPTGKLKSPSFEEIRSWFFEASQSLDPQCIKNSFISCGITFGLRSMVNLNQKLSTTFGNLIDKIGQNKDEGESSEGDENEEGRESDENEDKPTTIEEIDDPYKDEFEREIAELMSADQDLIDFVDE